MPEPSAATPPGWYPDPHGLPLDRYWNGALWTNETRQQSAYFGPSQTTPTGSSGDSAGTASIVLACVGIVIPIIPSIIAIIFGAIGMSKHAKGEATNVGSARAGVILGVLMCIVYVFVFTLIALEFAAGVYY